MEAEWVADRSLLRHLLQRQPTWTNQKLADTIGRSVTWVKKWKKRLVAADANDDSVLQSQSRARKHPPKQISQPVVEAILEIRDQPREELQRTPGPLAIIYYLQRHEGLTAAGHAIPTSTSTIWRILDAHQRILRSPVIEHEPLERPAPNQEWQIDFKDVTTACSTQTEKRMHQVETFDVVDAGTSILVANPVRSDFNATTVIETLIGIFAEQGLPRRLRFDRDTRFVGSASGRDFPVAFVRFLYCIGVEPIICPPHQPQKNPFVERFHRSYEEECIRPKKPTSIADVHEVNAWFRDHYNHQRPHQGLSCGNRPPCVAFPNMPALPPLPQVVDPDTWVAHIAGRHYRRRITSRGSLQIGRQVYYIGTEHAGQTVSVAVRANARLFDVILNQTVLKSLSIKGLHEHTMTLDEYVSRICHEAESEYRHYLASRLRRGQVGAM